METDYNRLKISDKAGNEDNWLKLQDWIVEKMKNCDGALIPMSREEMEERQEPELDYQYFLENASRTMIRFKKPERLIRMIVRVMDEQVKVTHTAMLLRHPNKNSFNLIDSQGAQGVKIPIGFIRLTFDNPLIKLFNERHNYKVSDLGAIEYKEMLDMLHRDESLKNDEEMRELIELTIRQMELLKANLCIPIYYKKDLFGVFVLGKKLSNVKFSRRPSRL